MSELTFNVTMKSVLTSNQELPYLKHQSQDQTPFNTFTSAKKNLALILTPNTNQFINLMLT